MEKVWIVGESVAQTPNNVYNDTLGHPVRDKVIFSATQTVASYLKRNMDLLSCHGGDEFAALPIGNSSQQIFEENPSGSRKPAYSPRPDRGSMGTVSIRGIPIVPDKGSICYFYSKIANTMLYDAKYTAQRKMARTNRLGQRKAETVLEKR